MGPPGPRTSINNGHRRRLHRRQRQKKTRTTKTFKLAEFLFDVIKPLSIPPKQIRSADIYYLVGMHRSRLITR